MESKATERTAENAVRLAKIVPDLSKYVDSCSAIPSAKDFEESVKKHLIPALRSKQPIEHLDALLDDKTIAGRRFIWAALKDENLRNALRGVIRGVKRPEKLCKLLFTHFRAELALVRNLGICKSHNLDSADLVYAPSKTRSDVLKEAFPFSSPSPSLSAEGKVQQTVLGAWLRIDSAGLSPEPYLPIHVRLALAAAGNGVRTRIDFLKVALEYSATSEAQSLRGVLDTLNRGYLGANPPAQFLSKLEEDLFYQGSGTNEFFRCHSTQDVVLVATLIALAATNMNGIATAVSAAAAGLAGAWPCCTLRFRSTRIAAGKMIPALQAIPTPRQCVERFEGIFGEAPPR